MVHLGALLSWAAVLVSAQVRVRAARRNGKGAELEARRRTASWMAAEHLLFVLALTAGLALMASRGWGLGHARWLGLKLGLVAFLLVPLEGMHAYICHGWIGPGLRATLAPPFAKDLERGVGMEDMLRAIAIPLLALALPLLVWLSLVKPS